MRKRPLKDNDKRDSETRSVPSAAQQPGLYRGSLGPNGRRVSIAIPRGYSENESSPLVLALHWGGPLYPFIGGDLLAGLVEPALRELGAIMVAPDRTTEDWINPQSEADLLDLLDRIQAEYAVDPARTLITGYSIGGMGTWYMAARNQGLFAAAIPISAQPLPGSADVGWEIPLYVIHGRQDELFPLAETEAAVRQLEASGVAVELAVVDPATHFETERFREPLQRAIPWIQGTWGQR